MGTVVFMLMSWKYNALLSGDATARSMGVNVDLLRFVSMLLASVITAVCVSFLGVIGFVGYYMSPCDEEAFGAGSQILNTGHGAQRKPAADYCRYSVPKHGQRLGLAGRGHNLALGCPLLYHNYFFKEGRSLMLRIENLSFRYSKRSPAVLNGVTHGAS